MFFRNMRELREKVGDVVVARDLLWYFDDLRVRRCRLRRPLENPLPSIPRLPKHLTVEIHLGQVRTAVLPRDERAALPRVFSELVCDCLERCPALTHPPHRCKPPILQNVPLVVLRVPEVPHELQALPVADQLCSQQGTLDLRVRLPANASCSSSPFCAIRPFGGGMASRGRPISSVRGKRPNARTSSYDPRRAAFSGMSSSSCITDSTSGEGRAGRAKSTSTPLLFSVPDPT